MRRSTSSPTTSRSRSSGPRPATPASRQFVGGREELRRFIDAGDTRGWAHHVLSGETAGDVEFALGETRRNDSGERHRHLPRGRADRRRRDAWSSTWSRARPRSRSKPGFASMSQQTEPLSLHDGVVAGTFDAPQLVGSRCRRCGMVAFPRQASCAALHVGRRRGAPAGARGHAVDLDGPVLRAQVAALCRERRRLRALRRRVRRAARRGARRGATDRERSRAAADRHADGARARSRRPATHGLTYAFRPVQEDPA